MEQVTGVKEVVLSAVSSSAATDTATDVDTPVTLYAPDSRPALAMTDPGGNLISVNDVLLRMWGFAGPGELLGRPISTLCESCDKTNALWSTLQFAGACVSELTARHRGGTPFCVQMTANVVLGADAAPTRVLVTFVDMTEQKQEEVALRQYASQLEARTAELDAYAQTVAHNLANPLARVIGYAELLEAELDDFSVTELRHYLQVIAEAGRQANRTIKELLLLARVRGVEDLQVGPLDMGAIVNAVLGRMELLIAEHQPEIVLPEDWPVVVGYGPWLEQVWEIYLSNALKYGGTPPRVTLGWSPEGVSTSVSQGSLRGYRFYVTDDGPGIPKERWSQLFVPFSRLSPRSGSGHGLGLSIARHIIEKLGGRVGVDSEEGVGSSFWFMVRG